MKKRTKVILIIFLSIVVLIGGGVIWQWSNIKAGMQAMRYSKEELGVQIDEHKSKVEQTLKDYGLEELRDFTFEEEEAIRKGEISAEEAVTQLLNKQNEAKSPVTNIEATANEEVVPKQEAKQPQDAEVIESPSKSEQETTPSAQQLIKETISELYALKATYIGKLGELESQARGDYKALSKEMSKASKLNSLVSKYMNPVLSLQSECDGKVNSLLSTLKGELEARGEATEVIKTMQAAYNEEKELRKAYYLSFIKS